jgi:hypothetical protein
VGSRRARGRVGVDQDALHPVKAREGLLAGGAHERHLAFLLVYARRRPYEVDPFLRLLLARRADAVVARGREYAEDVVHLLLRVLLARDGRDLGKIDLVAQLGLLLILVDGEVVWAQDDVDRLPLLQL